ncbi:hypothetical protein GJ744_008902 [Endocarpon pusillum]|uniref:NACHT domain-containing protein n=1 Tax=Endocarpon pusillum TaxID=364733 RepID=A0A8H7AQP8_9EURO|nr:hypothetical protein GJ744_008902 [Endocarpon pusillum]
MRLLQRSADGNFSLTQVRDDATPPYAILSHTWGADAEEVTFDDLMKGIGKKKHGYKKIYFCAEQAARDGLEYFWIDTCCINKANKAELSHAINSMFRWYRNATRCYVYLTDVTGCCIDGDLHLQWDSVLGRSRWFTRGWTLQELLAPRTIEFFSCEGMRIGDRSSLKEQIQHITGVPTSAFQGARLSQFSVDERFLWMERRETKLPEDKVYSLLGILDIEIPLYYGEGAGNASNRVREMIDKRERCIQDLRLTDPRDDKKRIEDTKGGLLEDSYHWVLENADFRQWRDDDNIRLLWIKGDPGKGKTMLLCGIIDELEKSIAKTDLLSYFFCQATDSRINSATAVLRGLLYLLVKQQPSLVWYIQKKHDHAGKALFEDANAWVAVSDIFTSILRDPSLNRTFLIVDALDECVMDLPKLLDFVAQNSRVASRVQWIVSSRNWPTIGERVEMAVQKVRLCLELNAESVAAAVSIFIKHKVLQLALLKKYNDKTRDAVSHHLSLNAEDTFLWVALVCQSLQETPRYNTLAKLNAFPPGLDSLYERMMQQICASDSADLARQILALIAIVYRPITILELVALVKSLDDMADDLESVREIISLCGSFLTNRGDTVYFVHQSAKDFLYAKAASEIFPSGIEAAHYAVFSRSLKVMSTLQRDMYSLRELGYPAELVEPPDLDLLAPLRYSCIYWIDHLNDGSLASAAASSLDLQDSGAVYEFFREKYLYWLEALSLCKSLPRGVVSVAKLKALVDGRADATMLNELVQDAHRFVMAHKGAIENSPLQVYVSALLFSPASSLVRGHFKEEEPQRIAIQPSNIIGDQWSACLSTLEGHNSYVLSVAFSHDSARLASASHDNIVKIWDPSSSACLLTLRGHINSVKSVAFSHDSTRLASASAFGDNTVKIWDPSSSACLLTLRGHSNSVNSVAFSHDSTRLASASDDNTVKIWDPSSSACLMTLKGHLGMVKSVAFSHNSTQLASASDDNTVKIWDPSSSACLLTLRGHSNSVKSVAFSHDSARLASASGDVTVKIWDPSSGACLLTCKGHSDSVKCVVFSHDSTQLASASDDNTVKIWDPSSGVCLSTLEGHSSTITSIAFSHNSARLASASIDNTVKIWDLNSGAYLSTFKGHSSSVRSVVFSYDLARLASTSYNDDTIKIWDPSSGACLLTLEGDSGFIVIAFSHNSAQLASTSYDNTVKIWDLSSGACLSTLKGHRWDRSVAFSHNLVWLASASDDNTIKIWDLIAGICLSTFIGHDIMVQSMAFSHNSVWLASAGYDIEIWDLNSGACLSTLEGHSTVTSMAFSHDSARLASASYDKTVKIWDPSSSACLLRLNVGQTIYCISFDHTDSYLNTEIGTISLRNPSDLTISLNNAEVQQPQYKGLGLSSDGVWITYNSKKFIWLPSEYRPSCSAVLDNVIGVGTGSGKVWFISMS